MSAVLLTVENRIAILTINRPESLNALNSEVLSLLSSKLDEVKKMDFDKVRCLIVTGAGEKAFVAGADIKEINSLDQAKAFQFAEKGHQVFRALEQMSIPTIAAVNGFALGGGLELALSCDFIYAAEKAKLGLPEVTLGLIPGFGGTIRLQRVVGKARAKEMILSGNAISASEALACGLVNKIFPVEQLMAEVLSLAQTIITRSPVALAAAKTSLEETEVKELPAAIKIEAQAFSKLFLSQDMAEGTAAFIEKRKPVFKGI